jgi:lipopolysaccharide export LptBFGC system permease protein LptF
VRILSRRLLASYLATLAACLAGLLLALAIVDMLVDFEAVVEGGGPALLDHLARVPGLWLREALPFASFAAAFLAVALPARRGEMLAVCAAGIHPARATLGLLCAALAVAAAGAWLPEARGGPAAGALAAAGAERAGTTAWGRDGDRVLRIGKAGPPGDALRDVSLFELDAAFRLRRWLRAEQARAGATGLELHAAEIRSFDPARPGAPLRAETGPEWLPLDSTERAAAPAAASPVATAAAAAALTLVAVALGLGVRPTGSHAPRALAALACVAAFRGAWQAAAFGAEGAAGAAALAPWLALAPFAALAAGLWARVPR